MNKRPRSMTQRLVLRLIAWTIIACAAVVAMFVFAFTASDGFSRRLINWYIGRLGGKVFEPVCVLLVYPSALLDDSLHLVDIRLNERRPAKQILKACRLYRGCFLSVSAECVPFDVEAASLLGRIPALGSVGLANCDLTDDHLALIGLQAKLESISVTGNPIDGSGFTTWGHPETVMCVDAQSTAIGDATIDNLLVLTNLRWLNLSFTAVTDESCQVLARLPKLDRLIVDGTAIGDDGLVHLASSPSLTYISAIGTRVSSGGVRRLQALRPNITVTLIDPWEAAKQDQPAPPRQDSE